MNEVNLLPEKDEKAHIENSRRRYHLFLVVVFSVIWGAIVGGVLMLSGVFVVRVNLLESSQKELKAKLAAVDGTIVNVLTLKQKVAGIDYVSSSRFDFGSSFDYVYNLFTPGLKFTRSTIKQSSVVGFGGTAKEPNLVADFVRSLSSDPKILAPRLAKLQLTEEGVFAYSFDGYYARK